ncbi:Pentatricopeptide repeat-containing protein [Glycine soja]
MTRLKSRYPNYYHNGPVYATMISILGTSGRLNEMRDVIEQMKEDSCESKDSVFVSVIKTYVNAGLVDEAISLYKSIPRFNCVNWTESFNTMLQIMVKENRLEIAHRLFVESSCGWEVRSLVRALNLLMYALCQKSRSDLALQLFQEMDYQSCYPNRDNYAILMKGLCQDRRLHEATHLLYSMFWRISQKGNGEDIVVYRTLLDALCDAGKFEEAEEILGKILRKRLKAPTQLDLGHLSDGKDIENAKRIIHEALIKGSVPSLASYNAMVVDLYSEGKIDEADKVIIEMQVRGFKPTHSIFEAKVAALCKVSKVDEAIKVIEEDMVKVNCLPTAKMYNILLKNLCNVGNSTTILESLNKMSSKVGCTGDRDTHSILLEMLCGERRYLEASQLLEKMSIKSYWPCTNNYNSLIRGLCFLGRQYEAVMWLENMISQGKLLEISVWNSLASLFCNSEKIKVSSETFSRLRRKTLIVSGLAESKKEHGVELLNKLEAGFAREHIGAKTEYDFGRVRVYGERSLGNNRRARFNALYQVPEFCDINKIKGKFDGKTVIITIPTIPGKVPKKETQPTEQEPPKEPSQETESNPEEEKEGTPPSYDNQESKEEAGHATSTSNPPNI